MDLWGKPISDNIKNEIIELLKNAKEKPILAIIRVGEEPDQLTYERSAIKKLSGFGIDVRTFVYQKNISAYDFEEEFKKINSNIHIRGILILRPLPSQLSIDILSKMIDPKKDLDGISPFNMEKIMIEDDDGLATCTAQATLEILKGYNINIASKHAVIVNNSLVVGKSLAMLLLKEDATVTICHTKTDNLKELCKLADILVVATGNARLFDDNYIKDGAVVIDIGINFDKEGKLCGDCNYELMCHKASFITPVPGGVGAVTTAVLGKHLTKNLL
ncbi:MAG: bifunctional 5,10-methylenetetrahydrofolate dehydrogenase/5,10-methenyltetrahydrofolate cyclohydrolase [Eubacteriales bacterium]|nr:bifunctional 5,10-methylenetetrahydrofolate dehydrogenase/5,10-methenyltetrahydrofolate cyclohydrolase [Eubacteriales bacterium]